ncbi:metallophosphoesterase family protein [Paenibacillus campi]|uniref:metallophosphoesterase family protein n=1 Tax=Paenibacillus campi TaxID=3106031 RepID=UPI002AFE9B08|nr:metallophosphoesterase family protein [Paenibacillus sp. SGZ-1014]
MIIGVVSDTHLLSHRLIVPTTLLEGLADAELIIHAGDFCDWGVYERLEQIAPVEAVAGNNDPNDIVKRLGERKIIERGGKRIGIVHGDGGFRGSTPDRAFHAFTPAEVDVIVFGHSHVPYAEQREGVLLFNPGSPTDKRMQPRYSYGKLFIEADEIRYEHYFFDKEQTGR